MNAANPDKSIRLQSVLKLLKQRKPYSTRDIIRKTGVCAVSAIISELRQAGHKIDCNRKTIAENGQIKTVYYYKLI